MIFYKVIVCECTIGLLFYTALILAQQLQYKIIVCCSRRCMRFCFIHKVSNVGSSSSSSGGIVIGCIGNLNRCFHQLIACGIECISYGARAVLGVLFTVITDGRLR